jgi:hypothetical protein
LTHEATPKTPKPAQRSKLAPAQKRPKTSPTRRKKNLPKNLQKTQKNGKIDLLGKLPT